MSKEFGRLKTDKRTLFLVFFIPIILIVIFGLTSGGGPQTFFTVSIITEDYLPQSDFANQSEAFDGTFISVVAHNCSTFALHSSYNITVSDDINWTFTQAENLIKNRTIDAIIVLPANFSECVLNRTNVTLQYIGDGSNLNVVNGFDTAMGEPISYFKLESGTFSNYSIALPNFQYGVPFWQPQILNYAVPLILPLVILGTTMNLTSLCIVTETPLPRLVLTPSGKKDFIISKLFAYSIVMLIQIAETFTCINIFGLYCRGSLLDFFLSLLLVGFTGICMGMAVSAVANTSQQANQMFIALFIMLALFSNAFISVDSLPSIFHSIAIIFPLTHAIPLVRDITLRGLPLTLAGAAPLLILSFVYLLIAYIAFARKKVEV